MRFLLLLCLVFTVSLASARTLRGEVVGISDGDTLKLLAGRTQYKIRLGQIDSPESDQAWGARAKQSLSELAYRKNATIEVEDEDRYGRIVGAVWIDGQNVNLEQVRRGMAWVYRQYARDRSYFSAEDEARAARRGLWSDANPTPPWQWRRNKKNHEGGWFDNMMGALRGQPSPEAAPTAKPQAPTRAPTGASFQCGSKNTCREMGSCEEARFYLQQCGLKKIDGNGDGVPCEALCKN
jgi:endonuclease YncB( thermonuclease family)